MESLVMSRFEIVENHLYWQVVYDKETKVMYVISNGTANQGAFAMFVDSDGKPLLWEGESQTE